VPDLEHLVRTETAPQDFRSIRAQQLAQARQRHVVLAEHYPDADPAQLAAVTDDRFWGSDELWRHAALDTQTTPAAATQPNGQKAGRPKRRRWIPRKKNGNGKKPEPPTESASSAPPAAAANPAQVGNFITISPPGRKNSIMVGRIRSWVIRLVLLTTPMVMIGGLAYSCGSVVASSSESASRQNLLAAQADTWHLSTFPAQQAAAFGQTYLTLCLTHPKLSDNAALAGRLQALAAMTSAGVSSGCGWDGTGGTQTPLSITWTGTVIPAAAQYATGQEARLTYTATLTNGQSTQIALPIWVASASGSTGMRVVGEITVLPYAGAAATAPTPQAPNTTDDNLATQLQPTVLTPFLQAWAASDPVQLSLTVTSDASSTATSGMSGTLTSPSIDTVLVEVTKGSPPAYNDGDLVTAQTVVEWKTESAGVQKSAYDIFLRRVGGRWLVANIASGPVDQQGGAAAQTFTTTTPTTTASS